MKHNPPAPPNCWNNSPTVVFSMNNDDVFTVQIGSNLQEFLNKVGGRKSEDERKRVHQKQHSLHTY